MLIKLCNLPTNFHYQDVKNLIHSTCGISEIILDNLIKEKGKKKVTVGLAEEEDAALIKRKLHGYNFNGFNLTVEVVGGKKPPRSSDNPSSYQPPSQGYQVQAGQPGIPSSQYQLPRMMEMSTGYQNNAMPPLIAYPNIYGGMNQSAYANTGFQPQIVYPSTSYNNAGSQNPSRKQDNAHGQSSWVAENMNFWNSQQANSGTNQNNFRNYDCSNIDEYPTQGQSFSGNYNRNYIDSNDGNRGRGYNDSSNSDRDRNFYDRGRDVDNSNKHVWQQPPNEDSGYQSTSHRQENYTFSNKSNSQDYYTNAGNSDNQERGRFESRWGQNQRDGDKQSPPRGGKRYNEMDNDYNEPRSKIFKKETRLEKSGPNMASPWEEGQQPFHNKKQASKNTHEPYQYKSQSSQNKYQPSQGKKPFQNKPFQNKPNPNKNQPFQNHNQYHYKNQSQKPGSYKAPFKKPQFQAPQRPAKYNTQSQPEPRNLKLSKKQLSKGLRLDNMTPEQLKDLEKKRSITWRYQVGSTIATDMLSKLGRNLNNDTDFKQALKYAVVERINTLCGEDYTTPKFDMAQIYRDTYKIHTDAAFVKKVQDDIAKIAAEIEEKEPGATKVALHPGTPSRVLRAIAEKLPKYPMADKRIAKLLKKENRLIFEDESILLTRLQPGLQRALNNELNVMTEKIVDGIINDDRPPAEKAHDDRIGSIANELSKALKINIGKRLLGAGPIILRVFANPKLVNLGRLAQLLKKYGVVSIRKTEKKNHVMFIATCSTYEEHDKLVTMPPLIENGTTIHCKPFQLVGEKLKLKPTDIKKHRLIEYRNRIGQALESGAKNKNLMQSKAGNLKQTDGNSDTGDVKPNVTNTELTAKGGKLNSEGMSKTDENNSDQIMETSEVKTDFVDDGVDKTEGNVKDTEIVGGNFDKKGDDGNDNPGNDENEYPGNDEIEYPGNDGNDIPGNDGIDNPDNDGNDNPGNDGNDNPGNNGNDNPGNVGNDNPGNNGNDNPGDDENDNFGNYGNYDMAFHGFELEDVEGGGNWDEEDHNWDERNDNGDEEVVDNGEEGDGGEAAVDNGDEGVVNIEELGDENNECYENMDDTAGNDIDLEQINEDDLEDY